jgi:hypothetical protein
MYQFLGEFTSLKLLAIVAVGGGLYWLYQKYKDQTQIDDVLIAAAKKVFDKAEGVAVAKAKELETKIAQSQALEQAKSRVEAEMVKAREFADKIKSVLN